MSASTKFTVSYASAQSKKTSFTRKTDRKDMNLAAQRVQIVDDRKASNAAFWEIEHEKTCISRNDAAHVLHHLVHHGRQYQQKHSDELLGHTMGGKNAKKVLLFMADKEKLLHADISNLVNEKVDRDHRTFVANEIAKLELFLIPSSNASKKAVLEATRRA